MNNQNWLFGITEARAIEVIQLHQDQFQFDGGVSWATPKKHPVQDVYAVPVHADVAHLLSGAEILTLNVSLPSDWIVQPVMPTE